MKTKPNNLIEDDKVSRKMLPILRNKSREYTGQLRPQCWALLNAIYHVAILDGKRFIRYAHRSNSLSRTQKEEFRSSMGAIAFLSLESGKPHRLVKEILQARRIKTFSKIKKSS